MKVLISVGVVLIIGIVLVAIAIMTQQAPELTTEQTIQDSTEPEIPVPEEDDTVEVIATVPDEPSEPVNVTLNACRELEKLLLDDVEDAERDMNRKLRDYENAKEKYEQTLDVDDVDPALLDQYRDDQEAKEDEYEEAEKEHNGAVRKLYNARDDCGFL